jgi:phosphoglycerate dehydrogenase-like enzyme
MKIALLVNRTNLERFAEPKAVPAHWVLEHFGNEAPDPEKLIKSGAQVLVADAILKIGPEIIERMPDLRLIHSQGVAYHAIDLACAGRAGIYVCNNRGVNAQAVAEQTVMLMLTVLKKFRLYEDMVYAGLQMQAKTACFENGLPELGSCRIGLVGLGAIGLAVAERLKAFGCALSYYDKMKQPERGIEYLPLEELYACSDIVTLHVPVTPETKGMIHEGTLQKMKRGAVLINTARGELMDHSAVVQAILSGQLGGFGCDTLDPEPVLKTNPFLAGLPEQVRHCVSLSPHIAGITAGSFRRTYAHIWSNIAAVERGERPDCVVNGL